MYSKDAGAMCKVLRSFGSFKLSNAVGLLYLALNTNWEIKRLEKVVPFVCGAVLTRAVRFGSSDLEACKRSLGRFNPFL